jgi:hypothetical protein
LIAFAGIGILVLVVVVVLGLLASKVANERARIRAHERLDSMMVELRAAREASHVQNIDDFSAVDLKAVVRDYAAKFATELPHVPSYIQPLEGKDTVLAEDKRRWIITLIRSLPADADLAPLQEVPSKSFAAETIAKRLSEGPAKF